jgi:uncharacterized protein YndB with AHSA1/START domain
MLNDLIVSKSIAINANQDKVWKALTDPEIIKEYLHGTETITDWKAGSSIIFQGEYDGKTYKDKGVILENKAKELLSYSYWSAFTGLDDKPENYSTVTYTAKKLNDTSTEFTWTQKGFASEAGYKHSLEGMEAFLMQIKSIVER